MGKEKISKEDLYTIVSHLYKYRTMSPKKAMKELLKVDIVRNRYTKDSLYTTLTRVGLYTRTKQPVKGLGKAIMNILDELMKRDADDAPKYLERIANAVEQKVKNRVKTTEELIEELQEKKQKLIDKFNEEKRKIENKISELNTKMALLNEVCIEEGGKINSEIQKLREKEVRKMLGIESEV